MHRLAKGPFDLRGPHTLTGQIAVWLVWLVPYFGGMYLGTRGR